MEPNHELLLIDELDKMLSGKALTDLQESLRSDKGVAAEWEYLKLAVEAVEYAAIYDRVDFVRKTVPPASGKTGFQSGVVRNIFKISIRVAAILVVFLGVAAIYKYSTVSSATVYNEYYTGYTLGVSRGTNTSSAIDEAYKSKNWQSVITLAANENRPTAKTVFLDGMAAMELQQYPAAITNFHQVIAINTGSNEHYFQDEARYYLALSYLMNKQADKGVDLLNEIRQEKNNLYQPLASRISVLDLKIVDIKSKR